MLQKFTNFSILNKWKTFFIIEQDPLLQVQKFRIHYQKNSK